MTAAPTFSPNFRSGTLFPAKRGHGPARAGTPAWLSAVPHLTRLQRFLCVFYDSFAILDMETLLCSIRGENSIPIECLAGSTPKFGKRQKANCKVGLSYHMPRADFQEIPCLRPHAGYPETRSR